MENKVFSVDLFPFIFFGTQMKQIKKHLKRFTMPVKRPLSAYNIFFKVQRYLLINDKPDVQSAMEIDQIRIEVERSANAKIGKGKKKRLHRKTHGKIGFADLGKTIGIRWRACNVEAKEYFDKLAKEEKVKYLKAVQEQRKKLINKHNSSSQLIENQNQDSTPEVKKEDTTTLQVHTNPIKSEKLPNLSSDVRRLIEEKKATSVPNSPNSVRCFFDGEQQAPGTPPSPVSLNSHACKPEDDDNSTNNNSNTNNNPNDEDCIEPLPFASESPSSTNFQTIDEETINYIFSALGSSPYPN